VEENQKVFLVGGRCPLCRKHVFPRRAWCDRCSAAVDMESVKLSTTGVLYSFSEVHVAPPMFATPYVVGYIDLPEDVRIFAQLEHAAADLALGDRVEVALGMIRRSNDGGRVISYKFRKTGNA
jgi:uncharacterized OB-fold protein